jgi:alanine racemase
MTCWIEISEQRLAGNYRAVVEAVGAQTAVLAVVKANAYGHGVEGCSVALARAGARWLGVACASEGARARRALGEAGFAPEKVGILLMCGFLQENVEAIAEHALTPVVWTAQQVGWLQGSGVAVHVEVDTGMARQGVHPGAELDDLLAEIQTAELALDGIFTHFCAAEVAHSDLTQTQERRFEAAIAQLRAQGLTPQWVHAGSTSSVDNPAQDWPWLADLAKSVGARAMLRCGCALYGYCVPIEGADGAGMQSKLRSALRPVMQWKTRVLDLRELAAGDTVGYNATFTAPRPMRLAMLPVGYADGLRRELSGSDERPGGWVMLRGKQARIAGRVSMNLTMVDVSGIEDVRVGDEVVVLGDGITADDHARLAGTIPYEILCAAGKNGCRS